MYKSNGNSYSLRFVQLVVKKKAFEFLFLGFWHLFCRATFHLTGIVPALQQTIIAHYKEQERSWKGDWERKSLLLSSLGPQFSTLLIKEGFVVLVSLISLVPSINILSFLARDFGASQWLRDKESTCQCRRCGFDPWVGRIPWRRKWHPFQYSCLRNSKDRGAWWATDHGIAKEPDMI